MERTAKMVLVTGANRGMGLETCRLLARLGYQVIVTSRDEIRGKQVVPSLAQHGLTVLDQRLDVADPESVKQMVLRRARCCQMWYAKEPHSAFSKRHTRVLVAMRNSGTHDGLVTPWRKAEQAGALRTNCTCVVRKDTHANTFRNPRHPCRIAGAYFDGLSPQALERPCTASGVPGEAPWRAKDHFAHLTANEQGIQTLLRLTLTGGSLPDNLATMSADEGLAWSNQRNQTYVNAHRNDSMETLRTQLSKARQETLEMLEQFTDEQLAAPVSPSFLRNMTAGDLFVANAQHAARHMAWIEEGFRQV